MNKWFAVRLLQGINYEAALLLVQHWPNFIFYLGDWGNLRLEPVLGYQNRRQLKPNWVKYHTLCEQKPKAVSSRGIETFQEELRKSMWGHKIEIWKQWIAHMRPLFKRQWLGISEGGPWICHEAGFLKPVYPIILYLDHHLKRAFLIFSIVGLNPSKSILSHWQCI